MRILELRLRAFGHFTEAALHLSGGAEGLHLIYGPNEAGKSTSLRALKALLYGIPSNTDDNFLHRNENLRIGGRIRGSDGSELSFERRKGSRRTLLDPDTGKPLEDSVLTALLAGLERDVFDRRFGIDHDRLIAGGREILEGKGELGEMLFSAALGRAGLRALLKGMEKEADGLFKADSKGKERLIVEAGKEYKAAVKKAQDAALAAEKWELQDAALRGSGEERRKIVEQAALLSARAGRLERLRQAGPAAAARRSRLAELASIGEAAILPAGFAEERRGAVKGLEQATALVRATEADLAVIEREAAAIRVPEELLAHESIIESTYQRVGAFRQGVQQQAELNERRSRCETDAAAALEQLGWQIPLHELEALRTTPAQRMHIQELATQREALFEKLEAKRGEHRRHDVDLEAAKADLARLPPARSAAELADAVERTRRDGDLDAELAAAGEALGKQEQQVQMQLARFPHWKGNLEQIEKLALPTPETVDRFDAEFNDLMTRFKIHVSEIRLTKQRVLVLTQQMEALKSAGGIPDAGELASLRKRRDRGWLMVKDLWLQKKGDTQPAALAAAFDKIMHQADEAADRLSRDFGRVARLAEAQTEHERLTEELDHRRAARDKVSAEQAQLKERWEAVWKPLGVEPLTPPEMRAWLQQHQSLCRLLETVHESRRRLEAIRKKIRDHRTELIACLERAGEPKTRCEAAARLPRLDALLDECRSVIKTVAAAAEARKAVETRITMAQGNLPADVAAEQALDAEWTRRQTEWAAATASLGLRDDATPSQVGAVLARLDELFARLDEVGRCAERAKALDAEAGRFVEEVAGLCGRTAPELKGRKAEEAAAELHDRLKQGREDRSRLAQFRRQAEEKSAILRKARESVEQEGARLAALCREARVAAVEELPLIENRSEKLRLLRSEIEQLDRQLTGFCPPGTSVEDLARDVDTLDLESIPAEASRLAEELRELEDRRTKLDKLIGKQTAELAKMDGSAKALAAAEKADAVLTKARSSIERYVRLHLASIVLRRRIDEYRNENQNSLLTRAGELFSRMTLGSFTGVRTDFDDRDEPVVVGVRGTHEKVPVEGMSEGTRDQLYLALRLAGLEKYLATNEPIPFVLDDILINFDDKRSAATLQILGEFSAKAQVVYFTHHEHLMQVARQAVPDSVLKVSTIPSR